MSAAPPPPRPRDARLSRSGMTLLEVLLAVAILGVCLVGLMQGMTAGVATFHESVFVRQSLNVLARGDAEHPMVVSNDPTEDLAVSPDSSLLEGWTYERECLEDEDEDGLFEVRTRVAQGHGGEGNERTVVRLIYVPDAGGSSK